MGGRGIRCGRITAFCSRTMNGCRSIWGLRAGNEDWNAPREIPRLAGENARLRDDAGEKTSTDGIRMTDPKTLSPLDLETPDKTFLDTNELVINMGPQHPATHGVLRVILRRDGEKVKGLECVIACLHRGVEKIAEHRAYTMFNPYVDRMDYVGAVRNGLGYCEAVEKLLNVEAPPRAQYIRVMLTEKKNHHPQPTPLLGDRPAHAH